MDTVMLKRTTLYEKHQASGAKLVDFSGWEMPIHYGSQLEEHDVVRKDVGMFDISHITSLDVTGKDARVFLRYLLANDVEKLTNVGQALYTGMLDETGGILDDLIVYRMQEDNTFYRLIVNCATRSKDCAWINQHSAQFAVQISEQANVSMLAIQGPNAREKLSQVMPKLAEKIEKLAYFHSFTDGDWMICATGYTGEDGFEVIIPDAEIEAYWDHLLASDVKPCGLGARDTLRLEAGMNLYGTDMDESINPYEANMAWTVALKPVDRNFVGRNALEGLIDADNRKLVGIILDAKAILRSHQQVFHDGKNVGEITSGSFSPTLQKSIGLARVNSFNGSCEVEIRGKRLPISIVKPPFVRKGKIVYQSLEI